MPQPEAVLIKHADGRAYIREGVCNGCGGLASCCQYLMLPLARPLSEDEQHWVALHPGVSIVGSSIRIDTACGALDEGRCSLFGKEDRPQMCVRYPELPEQVIAGCAYTLKEA